MSFKNQFNNVKTRLDKGYGEASRVLRWGRGRSPMVVGGEGREKHKLVGSLSSGLTSRPSSTGARRGDPEPSCLPSPGKGVSSPPGCWVNGARISTPAGIRCTAFF